MRWLVPCFFFFALMNFITADDRCRTEVNIPGKALKGFVFKTFSVTAPYKCDVRCEREITCQSYNYVRDENSCELNNRTKEARPENFRSDPARFYIKRLNGRVPLGSIPELPAESCAEIMSSEGIAVSGDYWLDPKSTGTATKIYCYFGPAKGSLFHWTLSGTDNLTLHGAAKFVEQNGRTVLYLDGTRGTYAETSAVNFRQTDLTIAVWIKLVSPMSSPQEIYADWSDPFQFRFTANLNTVDGRLCFRGRRNVQVVSDVIHVCTGESNIGVDADVWRHVAITWRRADRTVRLYINGNKLLDRVVSDDPVLDFKNTTRTVYDIGLKKDTEETTHAYFCDLIIFTHELSENELNNDLFLNHGLRSFI